MSRIGEQVRNARISQGLTQKQLAKKVGVAEKYIQEVEAGNKILKDDILEKITKALDAPISDSLILENYIEVEEVKQRAAASSKIIAQAKPKAKKEPEAEIQEVWSSALGNVLADIPVFDYNMDKVLEARPLAVINKKIDGQPKEKVVYIKISDDQMSGFRLSKGDLAFGIVSKEIENNTICLLEYHNERIIRQVKQLDKKKILLISNSGSVRTETAEAGEVKILVKLLKAEIML